MDMLGIPMGTCTFQFWPREWTARELFVKTLLADFFNSLILGFEVEADFQTSIDEYTNEVSLSEFHQCAIWYDLGKYLEVDGFFWSVTELPVVGICGYSYIVLRWLIMRLFRPLAPHMHVCPRFDAHALALFPCANFPT